MTLPQFRDLLLTVTPHVYHYLVDCEEEQYICWQEVGATHTYADGHPQETVQMIQLDYFTKTEYDPLYQKLLQTLWDADIPVQEQSPVYDQDEKVIRYILDCEVI